MKTIFSSKYASVTGGVMRPGIALLTRSIIPVLLFIWLALCVFPSSAVAGDSKKVLILHSYHQGYLWTDMIQEGVSRTLSTSFPTAELYVEYMNTKRQPIDTLSPHLIDLYTHLYKHVALDVIVASDNNALDFLLKHRDTLFPGVPVIFCGINDISTYHFKPGSGYTGVSEDLDIVSTITVALQLHPGTQNIAVITDTTETGLINLGLAKKAALTFPAITFTHLHALTAPHLRERLKQLEPGSIVLALSFFRDPEERTFSVRESMEFILSATNRPVYTVWDFYMIPGAVGGKLLSGRLQGENAALLAGKILQGEKAERLPIIESPTAYLFDYSALRKFGISEKRLPPGSQVTGKPDTLYSRYRSSLRIGAALFTVQIGIIGLLWWNIARRRREESARQKVEGTLRETNELFALLMRYSPVYVFIVEVTPTHIMVLQASDNFINMVGVSGSEMVGKSMEEIFPPEFAAKIIADDRAVVASGEVLRIVEELNGRWYSTIKFPLVQGDKTVLAGFTIDITESRQKEDSLKASEAKFRSLVENSNDVIFVLDGSGNFVFISPAWEKHFGILVAEVVGQSFIPFIHPDDVTPNAEYLAGVMSSGTAATSPIYRVKTADGDWRSFIANGCRYRDTFGAPLFLGIGRDISEQLRVEEERIHLEKQLLHAQKLESLGVLAGGIAHDFNNILMAIIGNADLALMRLDKESPATENLHQIELAAARAADLAKQMLAYSGKGKFFIEHIDLNIVIEEMITMLEVSISKKAVLLYNLHKPLPLVEADATQMRQIIMNLVINASEAIGDRSGTITVTTGRMHCDQDCLQNVWLLNEHLAEGQYVYLEIADNGCGMDGETLTRLFDPFFSTKFTGRGLGMAAVLGIVRSHKGTITVNSQPGKGTSFKILLPVSGAPVVLSTSEPTVKLWHGSGKVLLVDDEETVRSIGIAMLNELGFTTITANDGQEAIEIFTHTPDIAFVILDLTMPHLDGEQCFRELRKLKPDVKVIMSSGYDELEVTRKFAGTGLAGFIQKPYRFAVLSGAIKMISARPDID
jgi:PAS domain S-box-containing protein